MGKLHICLFLRLLEYWVVEWYEPKICTQGNDHLSYQWHLCLMHVTPTCTFIPFREQEFWAPSNFLIPKEQIQSVSICLCMPRCSVLVFLGGIMLELNNAVLCKNEDSLCTFVLKGILLTHWGLDVGEVTWAKLLPWHTLWTRRDTLNAFSSNMCMLWPLFLNDIGIWKTFHTLLKASFVSLSIEKTDLR